VPNDDRTVLVQNPAGGETAVPEEDAKAAEAAGAAPVGSLSASTAQFDAERRAMFDNLSDKLLTFGEGIADALTVGLVHDPSEAGDVRRSVNSGAALLGQLTGTAIGLKVTSPAGLIAHAGEDAGQAAARAVLGPAVGPLTPRAAVVAEGLGGAGEMAALMGAGSVGHQFTDSVLGDKQFSGHAVVEAATLGAVLGGAVKFLGATFGRAASRDDVVAQNPLMDPDSPESKDIGNAVGDARQALDAAVDHHAKVLGAIKQVAQDGDYGQIADGFIGDREVALARAQRAAKRLDALSFDGAATGSPKEFNAWRDAWDDYHTAVDDLNDLMRRPPETTVGGASQEAREALLKKLDELQAQSAGMPDDGGRLMIPPDDVRQANALFAAHPELRAQYEELYGRPFQPLPTPEGDELPGGARTETSELKTPVQRGSASIADEDAAVTPTQGPRSLTGRFDVTDSPNEMFRPEPIPAVPEPPASPWEPTSPGGRFSMAEWTPTTLAGEGFGLGREVDGLVKYPDGFFGPAADVRANAEAFSRFMDAVTSPVKVVEGPAAEEAVQGTTPVTRGATSEATPVMRGSAGGEYRMNLGGATEARWPDMAPKTPVIPRPTKLPTDYRTPAAFEEIDPTKPPEPPEAAKMHLTAKQRAALDAKQAAAAATRRVIEDWYAIAKNAPVLSAGDRAAARIGDILSSIRAVDKGLSESAGNTDLGKLLGLSPGRTALGQQLNDLYTLRAMSEVAANASKGTVLKGITKNRTLNWIIRRGAGKLGASILGGVIGGRVGGPAGYALGAALATKYVGFAGRAAGIAGRAYKATMKAASAILSGTRGTLVARAIAGNHPYTYGPEGPIKDPVERMQEVQRLAASPATIANRVAQAAGDLAVVHPGLVQAMIQSAIARVQFIAQYAPPVRTDPLGQPYPPSSKDLRQFLEAENAANDLDSILSSIDRGTITTIQAAALQQAHAPVHAQLAAFLLKDPDALRALNREQQRVAGLVLGLPIIPDADPMFTLRQQAAWVDSRAQQPQQHSPTQALKIPGAGPAPSAMPSAIQTPSQSMSAGRAPGNE
jgi:hypothetical protein